MDCMLCDPESMVFMTLKELASKASVSEVTVLNACSALGFNNYNDVKYEFRKLVSTINKTKVQQDYTHSIPTIPKYDLNNKYDLLSEIIQEGKSLAELACSNMDMDKLFEASKMFLDASYIVICARGVSLQIAEFLSIRLSVLGIASVVVNTEQLDSVQAILPMLTSNMLVVCISLPDYYMITTKLCEFARKKNCKIVCITDRESHSPIAAYGDITLCTPTDTRFFLNSPTITMLLVDFLTSAINIEKNIWNSPRFIVNEEFAQLFKDQYTDNNS